MAAPATPRPSLILPRASSHSHSQPSADGLTSDRVTASNRRRGDFVFVVNPSGMIPHPSTPPPPPVPSLICALNAVLFPRTPRCRSQWPHGQAVEAAAPAPPHPPRRPVQRKPPSIAFWLRDDNFHSGICICRLKPALGLRSGANSAISLSQNVFICWCWLIRFASASLRAHPTP